MLTSDVFLGHKKTPKFLCNILEMVGNTPLVRFSFDVQSCKINLFAKLEYFNPTGSVKARAANYILKRLLEEGIITPNTTIVESSSGNFGVALSAYCKYRQLPFVCVVDPFLSPYNQMLMDYYGAKMVRVEKPDANGGYLISRLEKVQELLKDIDDIYWINQYGNPLNAHAYYETLGQEVYDSLEALDYAFIGVSSGGTITGLSQRLHEDYPLIQVMAVDVEGSAIFGGPSKKRVIPGIGSSIVPDILKQACIDEVVKVSEQDTVLVCMELLREHFLF